MQRQRGELVPIGEVVVDLDGPVQALIPSPPTQRHFTRADQVNQLVSASEADPDLGFMGRTMALCSLPRTNPGNQLRYVRVNGPYTLVMNAGGLHKLPFGNLPRLILAVGLDRSGTDPKPRDRTREVVFRVHAGAGDLQQRGPESNTAPQPDRSDSLTPVSG